MNPLERAIKHAGGVGMLAGRIRSRQSVVSNWRARGNVSAEGCAGVERATFGAVVCEELRPDLPWHRLPDACWPWHPAGRPLIDVARQSEVTTQEAQRAA
jgi:DNA-binding transcriptional regulator YdaS (Cro superfamily)